MRISSSSLPSPFTALNTGLILPALQVFREVHGRRCRLRWMNYLRPDVKRGNLTLHEHILILQLHCQFGNRWSKIAQHLPGRTDNEIKNYWRTRIEKLAKQYFNCHANSLQFRESILHVCLPIFTHQLQLQQHSPQEEEEELALSDHENIIAPTSSRVQPTTDVHDQILTDYYFKIMNNNSTIDHNSPGSEVANPLNSSSWITTSNLDSYNNQPGTPTMLSKYPHEQPVSQISHPSMSSFPTTTSSSKQADYFQAPPTRIGNNPTTTTTATSSAAGSIPAGEVHGFDDYGDIQYYYCCSSWCLGDGGSVDSDHHCYYSSSF